MLRDHSPTDHLQSKAPTEPSHIPGPVQIAGQGSGKNLLRNGRGSGNDLLRNKARAEESEIAGRVQNAGGGPGHAMDAFGKPISSLDVDVMVRALSVAISVFFQRLMLICVFTDTSAASDIESYS